MGDWLRRKDQIITDCSYFDKRSSNLLLPFMAQKRSLLLGLHPDPPRSLAGLRAHCFHDGYSIYLDFYLLILLLQKTRLSAQSLSPIENFFKDDVTFFFKGTKIRNLFYFMNFPF